MNILPLNQFQEIETCPECYVQQSTEDCPECYVQQATDDCPDCYAQQETSSVNTCLNYCTDEESTLAEDSNEAKKLSSEIKDLKGVKTFQNYEKNKYQKELEEKQKEYEETMKKIENTSEDEDVSSLVIKAESLQADIKGLNAKIQVSKSCAKAAQSKIDDRVEELDKIEKAGASSFDTEEIEPLGELEIDNTGKEEFDLTDASTFPCWLQEFLSAETVSEEWGNYSIYDNLKDELGFWNKVGNEKEAALSALAAIAGKLTALEFTGIYSDKMTGVQDEGVLEFLSAYEL